MRSIALAMVTCLAFWSGQAEATTYTITYKGVVSSGFDETGRFIAAGSEFNNEPFKLVFSVDLSRGFRRHQPNSSSISGGILGSGPRDKDRRPPASAVLTINGVDGINGGDELSEEFRDHYGTNSQVYTAVWDGDYTQYLEDRDETVKYFIDGSAESSSNSISLDLAARYTSTTDSFFGSFTFFHSILYHKDGVYTYTVLDNAYGDLNPTSISIEPTSPVPLPAALPLLGGAIGGLGIIGRWRKRRKPSALAA